MKASFDICANCWAKYMGTHALTRKLRDGWYCIKSYTRVEDIVPAECIRKLEHAIAETERLKSVNIDKIGDVNE